MRLLRMHASAKECGAPNAVLDNVISVWCSCHLLLFTVQLSVQDEGYHANASGARQEANPTSFSAVFAPLMVWMAFACFAILILGVATGKENERLHEFQGADYE